MRAAFRYFHAILRNRVVLIFLCALMVVGLAVNLFVFSYIKDEYLLQQLLQDRDYSYVGVSNVERDLPNIYRYHRKYLLVSASKPRLSGWTYSYTDLINVVGIQELADAVYNDEGLITPATVVAGVYGRLAKDEIAISQKVAEEQGLAIGSTLYVSDGYAPLSLRVKYIYAEVYTLFDINVDRHCYSVLLPADVSIAYYMENAQFLCFNGAEEGGFYASIHYKSDELARLEQGQSFFMALGSAIVVVWQTAIFWLYARKTKGVKAKLYAYGWSRSAIWSVRIFRVAIVLLPSLLSFLGICLWLDVPLLFMGLATAQSLLSGLICLKMT